MKKQSSISFASLGKQHLADLTTEVKETLAMDINFAATKKFTAAEVWNIQRQKRARVKRRFAL